MHAILLLLVLAAVPIPSDLPPSLGAELVAEGVSAGSLEVWLRREPPLGEPREGLGIAFGRLAPGAFAGVIRLASDWTDYKGQKIGAGLYTLRYAVEPVDGNHMGVSAWRDFFLLVPAADDPGPAAVPAPEDLYALSTKASRTNHPATLALFPVERVEKPAVVKNEAARRRWRFPSARSPSGSWWRGPGRSEALLQSGRM